MAFCGVREQHLTSGAARHFLSLMERRNSLLLSES
jgi:hypothetical protein